MNMSFSAEAGSTIKQEKILAFSSVLMSRSRSFTWFLAKVITLLHKGNQILHLKNPTEVQLLLEHVSFSKNRTLFSQT